MHKINAKEYAKKCNIVNTKCHSMPQWNEINEMWNKSTHTKI